MYCIEQGERRVRSRVSPSQGCAFFFLPSMAGRANTWNVFLLDACPAFLIDHALHTAAAEVVASGQRVGWSVRVSHDALFCVRFLLVGREV